MFDAPVTFTSCRHEIQRNGLMLNKVVGLCRAKGPARLAIFRRFNLLISNNDAPEELSVFAGKDGCFDSHYDLVSTCIHLSLGAGKCLAGRSTQPIGGATRFSKSLSPTCSRLQSYGHTASNRASLPGPHGKGCHLSGRQDQAELKRERSRRHARRANQDAIVIRHLPINTMVAKLKDEFSRGGAGRINASAWQSPVFAMRGTTSSEISSAKPLSRTPDAPNPPACKMFRTPPSKRQ